ncbi:MAG: Cellobiose phosphorylase [Deltaproteobacteria bacterium]|nr:Cellobiose phosphorylase [Deltaproteobacteria bacterium]
MRYVALVSILGAACGDNAAEPSACAVYQRAERPPTVGCGDPSDPQTLVACDTGSALAGVWAIDDEGLPAYDLLVDERCDDAATAYSPRPRPIRDPIHVIGDGFGTVAMAHASGGVELYTQDRGHTWPIRIDPWIDDAHPEFPAQLGGALGYVVEADQVASTRFEDLPVDRALAIQTRRFGIGYAETRTELDQLVVTRRVYALPGTRTLVTEVAIENPSSRERSLGVVELDDINLYQLPSELVTSDLLAPSVTTDIERRRRALAAQFRHHARYDAGAGVAWISTEAIAPTHGRDEVAPYDEYPATLWLATLDGDGPDAAWLADSELWDGVDRTALPKVSVGDAGEREIDLPGENQPGVLALRVAVTVPAGGRVVRRFALGVVPGDGDPVAAAAQVRAAQLDGATAARGWRDRLVWAAFPGQPSAGALQRELVWSSYAVQALATYDAYHRTRLLGQGGSYKFVHGIDGAIGDYALFAEAVMPIDPALAADTLALSLATQRAPGSSDAGRYPYATTGFGDYTDVLRYDRRSDAYFLVPSAIARYVALTRDRAFLDRDVAYWPRAAGATGSVLDHLRLTQQYSDDTLGFGAHGLVAMGTNDYADGVLQTATEPATPTGTSSTFNAWLLVGGFELASRIVEPGDAALAARYTALRDGQLALLEQFAWNGRNYERGFVDSGNPLGSENLYLEPQVLPIIAGAVDPDRRAQLLDLVAQQMDTLIGPMTVVPVGPGGATGGVDQPQVGGVWPVASAWLTEAYALADPARGWSSLVRNTLFAHAEAFPGLWYGVWSGPDSYYGPDAERPGEADAHLATALTDYPVLNTHSHSSVLRALLAVAGIRGTADGLEIVPHLPGETFSIVWPRLALRSTPSSIAGSVTTLADGPVVMAVRLPSGLRSGGVQVLVGTSVVPAERVGDDVRFTLEAVANLPAPWSITSL